MDIGDRPHSKAFPAHIREDGEVQTVAEHCRETACLASKALCPVHLEHAGYLAGLLHDMGKMKPAFEQYLIDAAASLPVRRGSVNHTFAGVKYMLEHFHSHTSSLSDIACELLAFAIGAHHGAFDIVDDEGRFGFDHRLAYDSNDYRTEVSHYLEQCAGASELEEAFEQAAREMERALIQISGLPVTKDDDDANQEIMFYLGLLARLLLSAVIEGDRHSTAVFMATGQDAGCDTEDRSSIWREALASVERKIEAIPRDTPVNQARHEISRLCRAFAAHPPGLYRLNVPTGGGKTLSGLRYALAHAERWNKRRVLYVAPLITILEQNADVIRKAVGKGTWVLEHHSNLIRATDDAEELQRMELLEENWNAPIIVTTLVQLLNTLFSGRTSCIRRFQALADSVIIIDEVQTVPINMLSMFNLAMNYLTRLCSTTVLLCSATQPQFEETRHGLQIQPETPVPCMEELWKPFARTRMIDVGSMRLDELPNLIARALVDVNSLLVVCNKKSEANELYMASKRSGWESYHLSASMCVAHRRKVLSEIYQAIDRSRKSGAKVVCVSTCLIEAGVDISFDGVIRLTAGMDSAVQSAGRCNRNGESDTPAPVWLVSCENERLTGLESVQQGKRATGSLLHAFRESPERFNNDLASQEAIRFYYRALYADIRGGGENRMDYPIESPRMTLLDLLSFNRKYAAHVGKDSGKYTLKQAFKTAGRLFSVFDNDTVDAIVPWGEGKAMIKRLMDLNDQRDLKELGEVIQAAKPFTVSLYANQVEKLMRDGALMPLCDGALLALADGYYSEETGLVLN